MKTTRPSADKTRQAILKAAKNLFLRYGFDGVSVQAIAEAAKVNTNLIFHHFVNKETLWVKVKEAILFKKNSVPIYDTSSAKVYFKSILNYRFELYDENPDLIRLIQWQQLTENEAALIGENTHSPQDWLKPLKKFQKQGEIKSNTSAEQMMLFIIFSTHAPFMQKVVPLNHTQKENYKNMIFDMCCQQFLMR